MSLFLLVSLDVSVIMVSTLTERNEYMFTITSAKLSAQRAAAALAVAAGITAGALSGTVALAPVAHAAPSSVGPGSSLVVHHDLDDSWLTCTAGPYVASGGTTMNPTFGVLTAGHCGRAGDKVYEYLGNNEVGDFIGTISSSFEGRKEIGVETSGYDYALILLRKDQMNSNGRVGGHKITKALNFAAVAEKMTTPGVKVCSVGVKSGYRCGTLDSVDTNRTEILANMHSAKGDSGGPVWISEGGDYYLIGTLSGAKGESTDGAADRVRVSPLDKPAETLGVRFVNSYG